MFYNDLGTFAGRELFKSRAAAFHYSAVLGMNDVENHHGRGLKEPAPGLQS